jgi:uncharacterized protein with WD repeat
MLIHFLYFTFSQQNPVYYFSPFIFSTTAIRLQDVDTSNTSYYGATGLCIITTDGVSENVSRSKDGPIHDVKWSPTEDSFVVAAGNMPSHSTLYDGRGLPV